MKTNAVVPSFPKPMPRIIPMSRPHTPLVRPTRAERAALIAAQRKKLDETPKT